MPVPNAASVTYLVGPRRARPLRCRCHAPPARKRQLYFPTIQYDSPDDEPWTPPADWKRKTPFVPPKSPDVPFKSMREIHAEVAALYPDAPDVPWEVVRDAIQSGTSRPLFRDS